jgi:chromosome segregation ATPase
MDNSGTREQSFANAPIEQVREILFGAQLKDMEVRFKRQEERFARELADVRDSLKKRLDSLENFMKTEVTGLFDRLKREQDEREAAQKSEQRERAEALAAESRERAEALRQEQRERIEAVKNEERERQEALTRLAADLSGVAETFERKIAKLAGTLDSAERSLKSLLLTESGSLNDKIEQKYAEALAVVAKTNAQIRTDMVYRAALSSLFAETVGGLAKPWNEEALFSPPQGAPALPEEPRSEIDEAEPAEEFPAVIQIGSADNY